MIEYLKPVIAEPPTSRVETDVSGQFWTFTMLREEESFSSEVQG